MKTLYLHIGTSKTGTSAVQHFLYDNREILASKGICYKQMPYQYADANCLRNAHFLIGYIYDEHYKVDREAMKLRNLEALSRIEKWFQIHDKVFLTDESIWHALKGKNKTAIEDMSRFCKEKGYILKVIVYVRRQDEFLDSSYRQWVRCGTMKETWPEVVKKPPNSFNMYYWKYLNKIADIIGKENVIARRYDMPYFKEKGKSIQEDFLEIFDLKMSDGFVMESQATNPSDTYNHTEIKRILNTLQEVRPKMNNPQSRYYSKVLRKCAILNGDKERFSMFSEEESKEFMKRFDGDNQKVADEFIGDGLPLFSENTKEATKWSKENEDYLDDLLRFAGATLYEHKQEIDLLKKQVASLQRQMNQKNDIIHKVYRKIRGSQDRAK